VQDQAAGHQPSNLCTSAKLGYSDIFIPIKLIFISKSAFLLGTRRFIFNFAIVKHAKTSDFWAHADTPKS